MPKKENEIFPGIEIHGLTLYLKKENTLVFGDLHLGYEEVLNIQGFLIPRFQYKEILSYLKKIFSEICPKKVIINGDLKHEFGRISQQEWKEVFGFLDFLKSIKGIEKIILIKGNHDTILTPLTKRRKLEINDYFYFPERKIYICHGHKIPIDESFKKAKILIISHDHPSLGLKEGLRVEKIKCFLKGRWNKKILIQIPSLNFVSEGTDITQEMMLSPFMKRGIENFEVYCVEDDDILYFGKVGNIYTKKG